MRSIKFVLLEAQFTAKVWQEYQETDIC